MKSIALVTLFLFLIKFALLKKENQNITGILYEMGIGKYMTKVKMILSTSTTNNTLFSNANRKYAYDIQENRNESTLIDTLIFNEIPIPELKFNIKIDPTNFNDDTIQGELGFGINLNGKKSINRIII